MGTDTEIALIIEAASKRVFQLEEEIRHLKEENRRLQEDSNVGWTNYETFIEPINNYFIRQDWFSCRDKNDLLADGAALNIIESLEEYLAEVTRGQ